MHNKTLISFVGMAVSIGGWFLWNILLALVFSPEIEYPIKGSFLNAYGRSLLWWLVLIIAVLSFLVFELGMSSLRKAYWPTDTDAFQELQKDPLIKARFEESAKAEGETVLVNKENDAEDAKREGEIQAMLDNRPRDLSRAESGGRSEPLFKTADGVRRRISVDVEANVHSLSPMARENRRSVDFADVLKSPAEDRAAVHAV